MGKCLFSFHPPLGKNVYHKQCFARGLFKEFTHKLGEREISVCKTLAFSFIIIVGRWDAM
jgi:hypothetical protein